MTRQCKYLIREDSESLVTHVKVRKVTMPLTNELEVNTIDGGKTREEQR